MPDWYDLNHWYWMARNAVQSAVLVGQLTPDRAMRWKLFLRDRLQCAQTAELERKAFKAFERMTKRYSEVPIHAE